MGTVGLGSGRVRRPSGWFGTSQRTLGEFWNVLGTLGVVWNGLGTFGEVRDRSGDPRGGTGRDG